MSEYKNLSSIENSLAEKLALARMSRWHHLSPHSIALVKKELHESLGFDVAQTNAGFHDLDKQEPHFDQNLEKEFENVSINIEEDQDTHLRSLIGTNASWSMISAMLWNDYNNCPTPEKAARIFEMAFVEASPEDALDALIQLMTKGQKGFYWHLHPKLRDFIIEHAPESLLDQFYWILARERDIEKLTGLELAYIFLRIAVTSDKTAAWMYFMRHQRRIIEAFGDAKHFGMTRAQLIYRAGELAFGLGYSEDARELFNTLPRSSSEKASAMQLMQRFEMTLLQSQPSTLRQQIDKTSDWHERLALLSGFCDLFRRNPIKTGADYTELNRLIESLPMLLPKTLSYWKIFGDFVVRHRDLMSDLPGLKKIFRDQAISFGDRDLDLSFWQSALNLSVYSQLDMCFNCIAKIHKYILNPREGEQLFWSSNFESVFSGSVVHDLELNLQLLLKNGSSYLNQATSLLERDRKRGLACIKFAGELKQVNEATLAEYFNCCNYVPSNLLHSIAANEVQSGRLNFATKLLIRNGIHQPFTNSELNNLWNHATRLESTDLAWRIATVLASRDALPPPLRSSWEISGERRASYMPIVLTIQDIEHAMTGFSSSSRRLFNALRILGGRINEFALISSDPNQIVPANAGGSTAEQAISNALQGAVGISKVVKNIVENTGIHSTPAITAPLAQVAISSLWAFALRSLAERLSIVSWGWSPKILGQYASEILPILGKNPSTLSPQRIGKWLSSLSSTERVLFGDLGVAMTSENHDEIASDLAKFLCRLAVIVYPCNFLALKSMQQIRISLDVLRDLEWFILSDEMTKIRAQHNIGAKIAIPRSLKREL